jgi:alpha-L-rhamnosidase
MRVSLASEPFPAGQSILAWEEHGYWPCRWIECPSDGNAPTVSGFRIGFHAEKSTTVRVHVTADERYELYLDGKKIGRGSERGDPNNWFFETYDLEFAEGFHWLAARVSAFGDRAPYAQFSVRSGFLLCPEDPEWQEKIGTGKARWTAKALGGYQLDNPLVSGGTGFKLTVHGEQFDWGFERGQGSEWNSAQAGKEGVTPASNDEEQAHYLAPATLIPQFEQPWAKGAIRHVSNVPGQITAPIPILKADDLPSEHDSWTQLIRLNRQLIVPPNSRKRVLLDLEDYVCAYPEVVVTGGRGGFVRMNWEEALFTATTPPLEKGNRDEIEGKYFTTIGTLQDGVGDCFYPDGGGHRLFETLWWEAGRYVEILVETKNEAMTIESLRFRETRYPLESEAQFDTDDRRFRDSAPIMLRTLQMCCHETYMDCPFYEQLQYIGDTRLQVLTTYVLTHDDRMPRKALTMFDASRMLSGLTQSRYPSRVRQVIPPFSLWFVSMVHDYSLWRDDLEFVRGLMPGVRNVLDAFRRNINSEGLLTAVEGWNFADWVKGWGSGIPPDGGSGISAVLNYQAALAFHLASDLETAVGEPEMALRHRKTSDRMSSAAQRHFWDEKMGLLADDLSHSHWSEHTQCLALLVGNLSGHQHSMIAKNLITDEHLSRTTIYFSHYLFEALYLLGRPDKIIERLDLWFGLRAQGFKTTLESPEPTRSDCHAWGAHPLYHYFASFLGIRPGAPGFRKVMIRPQFGSLNWVQGQMPHPRGTIVADLHLEQAGLVGSVSLPNGVTGVLEHGGRTVKLTGGQQAIWSPSANEGS